MGQYRLNSYTMEKEGSFIDLKSTSDRTAKKEVNKMIDGKELMNELWVIEQWGKPIHYLEKRWVKKFMRNGYLDNSWTTTSPYFTDE